MAFKPYAEKVENLALEPVRGGPQRYEGVDYRMLNADAGSQAHAFASLFDSADQREGMAAFRARRPAKFEGK